MAQQAASVSSAAAAPLAVQPDHAGQGRPSLRTASVYQPMLLQLSATADAPIVRMHYEQPEEPRRVSAADAAPLPGLPPRPTAAGQAEVVGTAAGAPFLDLLREPPATLPPADLSVTAGGGEQLVRVLGWLIVLMCVLCLLVLGLRRWQRSRGLLPSASARSRVLETLSLGPGRTVSLIEIQGLRALVGADAGGIRTIVLAPPAFDDELTAASESTDVISVRQA